MNGRWTVLSMESRVCRAITATPGAASVTTGSTRLVAQLLRPPPGGTYPEAGNSRRSTANQPISISPSQKFGSARPTSDSDVE